MLILFPNILITLEWIHIFETCCSKIDCCCYRGHMAQKSWNIYYPALSGKYLLTPGTEEGGLHSERSGRLPGDVRSDWCGGGWRGEFDRGTQGSRSILVNCCHSLSHPICTFPHPHPLSQSTALLSVVQTELVHSPQSVLRVRKCSSDWGALKVTFTQKILLRAICIWETAGLWAIPSLWKSRWMTRKVGRVAHQCPYHDVTGVTQSSHLPPIRQGPVPFLGSGSVRP